MTTSFTGGTEVRHDQPRNVGGRGARCWGCSVTWRGRLWWRVFTWLLDRCPGNTGSWGVCSDRYLWTRRVGHLEIEVTARDKRRPEGYSREELVVMLRTVRRHERLQGWKCPEPKVGNG